MEIRIVIEIEILEASFVFKNNINDYNMTQSTIVTMETKLKLTVNFLCSSKS